MLKMLRVKDILTLLALSFPISLSAHNAQHPLSSAPALDATKPLRVAIVGAGAAGSSVAYHLSLLSNATLPVSQRPEITVFDPHSHAGGRSTTVDAWDNPAYPVELGASIFVKINQILYNASRDLHLATSSASTDLRQESSGLGLGVWDGAQFVFTAESDNDSGDGGNGWVDWKGYWDIAKLLWRYGLSPIRTQRLMKSTVGRFLRFYDEPIFPFVSLDEAVQSVDLQDFTGVTGAEVLQNAGIGMDFQRDLIQASTRVNYAQNLASIHGLEAMVCMAIEGAMSVDGGNWQIFQRMVDASGADFHSNTTVTQVEKLDDGTYLVSSTKSGSQTGEDTTGMISESDSFDAVILATPLQFSDITFAPPLTHTPAPIPYVSLYVTLLTSPHRLSPIFFGLESQNLVPDAILTTLPESSQIPPSARGPLAVGPAGFWSVSTLRAIASPDARTQYLYKVFSPSRLTGSWVSSLLDFEYANSTVADELAEVEKGDVSWFHEKTWNSYPYETPRREFERIRLDGEQSKGGKGVWYTSGIESFISTMETSALMGKNVARLVFDEIMKDENKASAPNL